MLGAHSEVPAGGAPKSQRKTGSFISGTSSFDHVKGVFFSLIMVIILIVLIEVTIMMLVDRVVVIAGR